MDEEKSSNKDILEHQLMLGNIGIEVIKILSKEKITFTELLMILETVKFQMYKNEIKKDLTKDLFQELFK